MHARVCARDRSAAKQEHRHSTDPADQPVNEEMLQPTTTSLYATIIIDKSLGTVGRLLLQGHLTQLRCNNK